MARASFLERILARRWSLARLVLVIAAACAVVAGASIYSLYRTAYREQLASLQNTAQTLAGLFESLARFDTKKGAGDHPLSSRGAILARIEHGLVRAEGRRPTEELLIGVREGETILLMRRATEGGIEHVTIVSQGAGVPEPLARALRGEPGNVESLDYRGVRVLAGFAFVPALDIGIVYKIDLAEMRAPYGRAAAWVALFALAVSVLGAWSLVAQVRPIERRAREERAFSNAVLENAGALIVVLDREGRIRRFNRACEALSGYSFAELEGRLPWETFLPPEDAPTIKAEAFDALVAKPRAGGARHLNYWRTKSGEMRLTEWSNTLLPDAQGKPGFLVCVGADVTDKHAAQAALERSRTQMQLVMDNVPALISYYDAGERLLYANRRYCDFFGVDPMHAAGRALPEVVGPANYPVVSEQLEGVLNGETRRYLGRRIGQDGAVRHLDVCVAPELDLHGKVRGFFGLAVDVTEERAAEQRLRDEQNFSAAIYDSTPALVIVHDRHGRIVRFNDAAAKVAGYRKEELVGRYTWEFLMGTSEDRNDVRERYAALESMSCEQALERFGPAVTRTWRTRDGQLREISWNVAYLPDENGMVAYQVACGVDITDRKTAEDRIRAALAEKEVLLKEIYHRVKNNLQVVASLLNMQGRGVADAGTKELLAESANRVKSMALVHEQLYRSQNLSNVSFAEYLEQLAEHLSYAHRPLSARVPVRLEVAELSLGIETAVPLGLIVNELVSNAYKHGYGSDAARGEIVLRAERLDDGRVRLLVADDGRGLPAGFDPANTDSLGLQLVQTLAQQLRGELRFGSQPGRTRFEILFRPETREPRRMAA